MSTNNTQSENPAATPEATADAKLPQSRSQHEGTDSLREHRNRHQIGKATTTDPRICRALKGHPNFHSEELYKGEPSGHKYKPGETRTLTGLEDFSEYNGQQVEITAIRVDGPYGKAYYVKGKINEVLNWVHEYRLV